MTPVRLEPAAPRTRTVAFRYNSVYYSVGRMPSDKPVYYIYLQLNLAKIIAPSYNWYNDFSPKLA